MHTGATTGHIHQRGDDAFVDRTRLDVSRQRLAIGNCAGDLSESRWRAVVLRELVVGRALLHERAEGAREFRSEVPRVIHATCAQMLRACPCQ